MFALLPLLGVLSACAAQPAIVEAPVASAEPQTDAGRLAVALASADRQHASGETEALRNSLRRIDALGAKVAEGAIDDPVEDWREQTGHAAPPFRGRPLGPAYRRGTLPGEGEIELTQLFLSGKTASLAISSPAGAGVDLSVATAKGKPVCNSRTRCRWTPIFTERYAITLRNRTSEERTYYLVVD